jgi:Transposase DDE domain
VTKQTCIKEKTMNNLRLYHKLLRQICQWFPGERITRKRNLALMMVGLYLGASVHLSHIARELPIGGKDPSLVNRLRRFLNNPRVCVRRLYRPVAVQVLTAFVGQRIRLVIDCTKVGFRYRLMTISLVYRKRTIPLVWSVHPGSRGHTTAKQQIELLNYVRTLLPERTQVWVMGDAGFQSVLLLRWLSRQHWHFVIRQPGNNQVRWAGQDWVKLNAIPLTEGKTRFIGWVRLAERHDAGWFWLILHWDKGEDEPWFLISDQAGKRNLINLYRLRMWTEEMYGDLKGHGFDLEATHLDDVKRISRLVLIVCLVFTWLITLGAWVVKRGLRHLIDHKSRRDKSYFRLGWDWLARCLRIADPIPIRFSPIP